MAGAAQAGRESTWEPPPPWWLELLETAGPWLLVLLVLGLVARALARRRLYRAVDALGPADREAVHEALRAAERRTVGEILPVVVERSDPHPGARWMAAVLTVLLGSALLEGVLPWTSPGWLLLSQLGLGAAGFVLVGWLPDLQRLLVPAARETAVVEEQAFQEFYAQGLHRTEAATGVLLFVSLLEHRVVVLADEGIAAKLPAEVWTETNAAVLDGIARGSLREGLIAGIRKAGDVLAEHAPWREGDRDEVPDRLVVRRE